MKAEAIRRMVPMAWLLIVKAAGLSHAAGDEPLTWQGSLSTRSGRWVPVYPVPASEPFPESPGTLPRKIV